MLLFLVLQHRRGLLRRVHQRLAAGTSAPGRSSSWASTTTPTRWPTRSSSGPSRTRIYYAVVWVPLTMAIGLFLAIIVNQKIRGQTFFRAAFYFPAIASSAAITILWIFIVSPDGLFNERPGGAAARPAVRRSSATAPNQNWIGDQDTALNSVIILNAWTTSGTFMLFYLASLQSITGEVYEAAAIDGAERLADVLADHLPAAAAGPLLRGHGGGHRRAPAVRPGDHRAAAPNGDPNNALMTVVLYLYNAAFSQFNFSYAAAVGIILFVVIFARRSSSGGCSARPRHGERRPMTTAVRRPDRGRPATPVAAGPSAAGRAGARRLAYVLLIGYAILMFVPFAWSVDHVVQDAARLGPADAHPGPVHARRPGSTSFNELDPPLPRLFFNSAIIAVAVTITNVVLGQHRRLRLRAAALPAAARSCSCSSSRR